MAFYAVYNQNGQYIGSLRTPAAIYVSINGLNAAQKTNIWNDFTSGNPPKWSTSVGFNSGAIGIGFALVSSLANKITAAELTDLKLRAVTAYVMDNPQYLEQPSFDSSINIKGYDPV
jgi:hypothetical protein